MAAPSLAPKLQAWVEARRRHRLSDAHVQMARELGMNPRKLGKIDNHRQEPWKLPLPEFIEHLYAKRFGRSRPAQVMTIEQQAKKETARHQARKLARAETSNRTREPDRASSQPNAGIEG